MRFNKHPRPMPYELTNRKVAAVHRAQRNERDKAPLFAEMIAAEQRTVDEEIQHRKEGWLENQKESRQRSADSWRKARARLAGYDDRLRAVIRQLWDDSPYPKDPVYLLTLMHSIDVGRVDPEHPPWRLTAEQIAEGREKIERYAQKTR